MKQIEIDKEKRLVVVERQLNRARKVDRPGGVAARVYNSANILIADNTDTPITFNSERFDTASFHSTSLNTSRLTAPMDGYYLIGGCARFESNATGLRSVFLEVDGTTPIAQTVVDAVSSAATTIAIETIYELTEGQYVELNVRQTSGGNLNVAAVAGLSPEAWIYKLP